MECINRGYLPEIYGFPHFEWLKAMSAVLSMVSANWTTYNNCALQVDRQAA